MQLLRRNNYSTRAISIASLIFFAAASPAAQASGRSVAEPFGQEAAGPQPALPEAWNDAVHALAKKIATMIPSIPASLDVKNNSSLMASDVARVQRSLETELSQQGNRLLAVDSASAHIHLTLSEGAGGFVWVAEIEKGDTRQVAIVEAPASGAAHSPPESSPLLQRKVLWQQTRPILDFGERDLTGPDRLWFVLEPDRLMVYGFSGDAQTVQQSQPISGRTGSRDPRGLISLGGQDQFKVYAGSTMCVGSWTGRLDMHCTERAGEAWPLGAAGAMYEFQRRLDAGRFDASLRIAKWPGCRRRSTAGFLGADSCGVALGRFEECAGRLAKSGHRNV